MGKYMDIAINEARRGMRRGHGGPFGAVLVCNGKVVARGHNTVLKKHDPTCHAEMNVIRKGSRKLNSFDLSKCEIYSTGKPCRMCEAAINWAKIKKVYYGNTYKEAFDMGFDEEKGNSVGLDMQRVDQQDTLKLVKEWNSLSKKRIY